MRLIALAWLLVGCAKGGVEFVIDTKDMQLTKVVLFVGVGDKYEEPIMPAMRGVPYPSSTAWPRDAYNELDEREVVPGEPVVFQFQGSGQLGVVIAVGYAGDTPVSAHAVRGIAIPSDYIARYELVLEPIDDGSKTSPLQLSIWQSQPGSPKPGKTCAALFDKRENDASAVVTDHDPDCDGWPTDDPKECQPNYYMSFARPALADVACLVTERVVSTDGTVNDGCVLGGPPCRDGVGHENRCTAPSRYCAPKSLCSYCRNATSDWDCARDVTLGNPVVPSMPSHLKCTLYFNGMGALCTGSLKALASPPPNIGGHSCKADGSSPVQIATVGQPWSNKVSFASGTAQLEVAVQNVQEDCNFEIVVSGSVNTNITMIHQFGAIVAGELDNGRGIAVPIVLELKPDPTFTCADNDQDVACQTTWSWDLGELVDQCINTPVFPP